MGFLNPLGAVAVMLICFLFVGGLFGLFPLPYYFAAKILKIPSKSYWRAFGISLLSLAGLGLFGWLVNMIVVKLNLPSYMLPITLVVIHLLCVTGLMVWIYNVRFVKALLIWLVALPFNLVIAAFIVFIWWYGLNMPVGDILKAKPTVTPSP